MDGGPLWPGGPQLLTVLFGLAGLAWGTVADRIAARWPAHEDGSRRGLDWRTIVIAAFGAAALAAVPERFDDAAQRALFGAFFAALVLGMATDLDQRLLPDVLTVPLMIAGALALAWGGNSLVARSPWLLAVAGAVIVPGILFAASIPFGAGALGGGDVKFLVGAGLMLGLIRLLIAVFCGAILGGVVVAGLLVARRITLHSYVPFGPFLIAGVVWATLLPAST
jgi:leader peptidase (prepilin peptidase) / N-methyltransferase